MVVEDSTLHIKVESTDEFFDAAMADLKHMEEGHDLNDRFELSLPDEDALDKVLSAKNIELLRAIANRSPDSVREVARIVERDVKNVSNALSRLEDLGLVEFEEDGRSKRPIVWYDEVTIDIRLSSSDEEGSEPAIV